MKCFVILFSVLVGIFCVVVEESFDEGETWIKRGEIKWKRSVGKFFPTSEDGIWDKAKIQQTKNYFIRFLKGNLVLLKKRVSVCDLIESEFQEKVIINGKKETKFVEYDLPSKSTGVCKKIRKKKVHQKMKVELDSIHTRESVDITGYKRIVQERTNQPVSSGGILGLIKSYWKYIIPVVVIFLVVQIVGLLCSGEFEKMMEQAQGGK